MIAWARHRRQGRARRLAWQLAALALVSGAYESLFVRHGLNWLDEGWPLYAAMRLHAGGTLYRDVFFVFPPGHLLPAWLAFGLAPPGVVGARVLYAAFNVALCLALHLLGRRLMPPGFALLGALLLALAAPRSHLSHFLFGYRYLVFPTLALLALAERLRRDEPRWLLPAGVAAGLSLCFRFDAALAALAGIGVGLLTAARDARTGLRDAAWLAAGFLLAAAPCVAWFAHQAGLAAVWREAVLRPLVMTGLQSLPIPELALPASWSGFALERWFVALQFRAWPILYLGYALALAALWLRLRRQGRPFPHALLAAVVSWGGIYFLRSLGRADQAHLDSALPPVCLLLAHALSRALHGRPPWLQLGGAAASLALFVHLECTAWVLPASVRGWSPVVALAGGVSVAAERLEEVDSVALWLRTRTPPGERILDLSASPILHVLADRPGPGHADVVMPGTFHDASEEQAFLARVRDAAPAAVVLPRQDFDRDPRRGLEATAPRLLAWVRERYRPAARTRHYLVMVPIDAAPDPSAAPRTP